MADGRPIYRVVSPMFWDDPDVRSLDATHQYIALHVLTCRQVTGAGIFRFSLATAGEDMAKVPVSLHEAFGKVCVSLKWRFHEPSKTLYLPTWWKWNPPDSPNHLIGAMKHLPNLPQTPLFKEFASNKKWLAVSLHEAFGKACLSLGVRLIAQEKEQEHVQDHEPDQENEHDNEHEKPSCRNYRFDDTDYAFAEEMRDAIASVIPNPKTPNLDKWAADIRIMREQDDRTTESLRAVFDWANRDEFWRLNILSPAKLRKQFDQLSAKMGAQPNGRPKNQSERNIEAANDWLQGKIDRGELTD